MGNIDPEVAANYRGLHETTGESYDSITRRVEAVDPATAAKLREEFGTSKRTGTPATPEPLTPEPVDRQPAPKQETEQSPAPKRAPAKNAAAKKTAAKS